MTRYFDNLIESILGAAPAYLRWHTRGVVLPPYQLAIFDDPPPPTPAPPAPTPPTPTAPAPTPTPPAPTPTPPAPTPTPQARNEDGKFVSRDEFDRIQAHNKDLGTENGERRRENKELKSEVEVLRSIRVRDEVSKIITDGGAISERIVDLFIADQVDAEGKSALGIDKKTGRVTGLEKLDDWKRENPTFFKPDTVFDKEGFNTSGFNKAGFNKDGFDKDGYNKDGKDKDGKAKVETPPGNNNNGQRPNRTSAGAANGAGSGTEPDAGNRQGLPDLTKCKDAAERRQVVADWKRSLRGAGGGFGKASSRR